MVSDPTSTHLKLDIIIFCNVIAANKAFTALRGFLMF